MGSPGKLAAPAIRPALWLALAAIVGSAGSYALLVIVARTLPAAEYGSFSLFWSVLMAVGLGCYQPIEAETSRRIAPLPVEPGRPRLLGTVLTYAAATTIVLLIVIAVAAPAIGEPGWSGGALVVAAALTVLAYTIAFPVRGIVSGRHRPGVYAATVALDGVLRTVLPLGVLLIGGGVIGYAFTIPLFVLLSCLPAIGVLRRVRREALPAVPLRQYAGSTLRIVVAAFCVQALLAAPVVLAGIAAPHDPALPGLLMSALTIARIPVVLYQGLQPLYLPRVARAHATGGRPGGIVAVATLLAAAVAAVTVLGFWLIGSWAIGLLFGPDLVPGLDAQLLLAGGAGAFLVAMVLSDACVATGRHTALVAVWVPAVGAALLAFLLPLPPAIRSSLPLLVAAVVAAIAFGAILLRRSLSRAPAPAA